MTDNPTLEELQSQILALKQENEQQKTQISALEAKHTEDEKTIKQVRDINTKLFQQTAFGDPNKVKEEPEEHVETMEEFCESFIKPARETIQNNYGVKFR